MTEHVSSGLLVLAILLAAVGATLAWQDRRVTTAAGPLAATLAGVVWWSAADLARVAGSPRLGSALALATYPGVALTVAGYFGLALACARPGRALPRRALRLLALEPAALLVAIATNPALHLLQRPDGPTRWHLEPVYWVHTGYSYLLVACGAAVMLRAWSSAEPYHRRQLAEVLGATTAPLVLDLATVIGLVGDRTADLTPLAFSLTGGIATHAILRRGLLRVVPVARELVLERIGDAVLVLAPDGRIADLNPAAAGLLRRAGSPVDDALVGRRADDVLPWDVSTMGSWTGVHRLQTADGPIDVDVRLTPLPARGRGGGGLVLVGRDITELSRHRQELAQANEQLREQLRTIEALRARLAEQAVRDPLTGLHNRRHLDERMPRLLVAADHAGLPLGVVMIDVDHFKQVNDVHGHPVGDALLVEVATLLHRTARRHSPGPLGEVVTGRQGGEEFVLLLPGLDLGPASEIAEEIRRECTQLSVPGRDGTPVRCTVSAGVAAYPQHGRTRETLLRAADDALYTAKARGRNAVVAAPEATTRALAT